ncbi:MAG: NAD(P)H-binding protein [Clostridia bacterium]|nr:NAD(P)H-binding protein [Clostridia bacterium]
MKIFIVGGTGFLGYHTALEALKNNYEVATISLEDIKLGDWFPKEITVNYGNIFDMEEEKLISLFKGYDYLIYSVGPDDRVTPKAPAYQFFYDRLVVNCTKVISAARQAGIKKSIVFNSYFAYFDRERPLLKLSEKHPYIKCRVEQASRTIAEGQGVMDVCILELPYIFGTMPERMPIWKELLVDTILKRNTIYFTKGGTAMISVEGVASAVIATINKGVHGERYPICDVNMDYMTMLSIMQNEMGFKKEIKSISKRTAVFIGRLLKFKHMLQGKESGLDPVWLMKELQTDYLYIDCDEIREKLGFKTTDIEASIRETISKCI